MKYIDLHCDTLSACVENGESIKDNGLQTSFHSLIKSNCVAQCFAVFTQGTDAARTAESYIEFYKKSLEENSDTVAPILRSADFSRLEKSGKLGCILTVENLGFIEDDLSAIQKLKNAGVRMASLVWNYENQFAYPNLIFENDMPQFLKREKRGLKPLGRQTVEALDDAGIIIDISHLSDGGAEDILNGRKKPIVASHSNAATVFDVSRNLTDGLIKKIADCGGVIGVNFCKDFLGGGDTFAAVLNHINHIISVGGEDVIALGSDFDGIPPCENLEDCTRVPALFQYLQDNKIPPRVLEKLAFDNFYRVFKEICG